MKKKVLHIGHNSNIIQYGDRVVKEFKIGSAELSASCLKSLSFSRHFPKLIEFTDKSITINYCGEELIRENMPCNWEDQMYEMLSDLRKAGIQHNDCVPKNLLVKDNTIYLIDFGMAIFKGKHSVWIKTDKEIEEILEDGDEIMLRRAFDFIRGKKIDKYISLETVPPYRLSNDTEWKDIAKTISRFGTNKIEGSSMGPGRLYQKLPFHIKENDLAPRGTEGRIEMMKKAYDFKGKVGIDFGCGTGAMVFALRKLGAKCYGIERDEQAIDIAWAVERYYETGAKFFVGDLVRHIQGIYEDVSRGICPQRFVHSSVRLDFCLFLSVLMWIIKYLGKERVAEIIYYLGESFNTMFFETSLGDAGAGGEMTKAKLTSIKSVVDFVEENSAFVFVKSLGKSKDWYNRETLMFERSPNKRIKKFRSIKKPIKHQPVYLNLGCGQEIFQDYINCDLYGKKIDIRLDAKHLPFKDGSVDRVRAYHLIEHFNFKEAFDVLREWNRVLKPDGELILETPDMLNSCKKFVEGDEGVRVKLYGHFWAWPWESGQAHKFLYTEVQLGWTLKETGFRDIRRVKPDSIYARSNPNWELLYLKVVCKK